MTTDDFSHPLFDEIYQYQKLISTSKQAIKMIKDQSVNGNFLIISDEQTGGKGRGENLWFSPSGGIWLTTGLYGLTINSNMTIFTGICIHKALCRSFPELKDDLKIKWPNDVFFKNKKLCGILSQYISSTKYHLIGMGINTNIETLPQEISESAVSLFQILNIQIDNFKLIQEIFDEFTTNLPQMIENGFDLKYYKIHSFLKGKEIILNTDFDKFFGTCKGISKDGAILIELKPGMIQPFYAGTVIDWKE